MNTGAIEDALHQLQVEGAELLARGGQLEVELRHVRDAHARVLAAIESLRRVLGPEQQKLDELPVERRDAAVVVEGPAPFDLSWPGAEKPDSDGDEEQPKRIRSTAIVANLLANNPRVWTFDEIVDAFEYHGWSSRMQNPRNALRTALTRATKRGSILAIDETHFRTTRQPVISEADHG